MQELYCEFCGKGPVCIVCRRGCTEKVASVAAPLPGAPQLSVAVHRPWTSYNPTDEWLCELTDTQTSAVVARQFSPSAEKAIDGMRARKSQIEATYYPPLATAATPRSKS